LPELDTNLSLNGIASLQMCTKRNEIRLVKNRICLSMTYVITICILIVLQLGENGRFWKRRRQWDIIFRLYYTTLYKKLSFSPSPAGMSLTKLFLAGNNLIIPGQEEFAYSDIPGGDGKNDNLFLQCNNFIKLRKKSNFFLQVTTTTTHYQNSTAYEPAAIFTSKRVFPCWGAAALILIIVVFIYGGQVLSDPPHLWFSVAWAALLHRG
jgi:hypothetical protein